MRTAIGLCYQVLPVKDKNQGEIAQFTATQRKGGKNKQKKKTPHIQHYSNKLCTSTYKV